MKAEELRDTQALTMSEARLLESVRAIARAIGWLTYHTHRSDHSEPGFPDLVLVRRERFLLRELKSETGRLTPFQERWIAELQTAGLDVGIWRPRDLVSGRVVAELGAGTVDDEQTVAARRAALADAARIRRQGAGR